MIIRLFTWQPQGGDTQDHPHDGTVLAYLSFFHREGANHAAPKAFHILKVGREIIGVCDAHEAGCQHLSFCHAQDLTVLMIDLHEPACKRIRSEEHTSELQS